MEILGSEQGAEYFIHWVRARFMEMEVSKVSEMMSDLFRKCRRKAWLYLDKLRVSEAEELALLSSIGNQYDARLLQQAALLQDRHLRRPSGQAGPHEAAKGKSGWQRGPRWPRSSQQVHITEEVSDDGEPSDGDPMAGRQESDDDLVDEQTAADHHTAYVAYQAARDKYKAALRGRGTDPGEIQKKNEERLRQAKLRSFCSACKRRGHWHKDPECPLRGRKVEADDGKVQVCNQVFAAHAAYMVAHLGHWGSTDLGGDGPGRLEDYVDQSGGKDSDDLSGGIHLGDYSENNMAATDRDISEGRQECIACEASAFVRGETGRSNLDNQRNPGQDPPANNVFMAHQDGKEGHPEIATGEIVAPMTAIVDTACTRTVAGYQWFEDYCLLMDSRGYPVHTRDSVDYFKFGASRVHRSDFAVDAWFATKGRWYCVNVAVVPCKVPLLFSRPVLSLLGANYNIGTQEIDLHEIGVGRLGVEIGGTGHPVLPVSDFPDAPPPNGRCSQEQLVWIPQERAYMATSAAPGSACCDPTLPSQSSEASPVDADPGPTSAGLGGGGDAVGGGGSGRVFFPKKVSSAVHMLVGDLVCGGQAFFTWWGSADQSRDFWVETDNEFIRIHVVPRKYTFDPDLWTTKYTHLREELLRRLGPERQTESILCLSEGAVVKRHTDMWQGHAGQVGIQPERPSSALWVGRSRFAKAKLADSTPSAYVAPPGCPPEFTMEGPQGGPAG